MSLLTPVILSGGSGTRLWPRSRPSMPKPFLPLVGRYTLFEEALLRVADPSVFAAPLIVAGSPHAPFIEEQSARHAPAARFVIEPMGKNTAPAIALAALALPADAVMLVCPSDHYVADTEAFTEAAIAAADLARDDWLVSFGIAPHAPETGYGYIRRGNKVPGGYAIDAFVEKPDLEHARQFLASGDYSWNGGIFAFRAGRFLAELERFRPEMTMLVRQAFDQRREDGKFTYPAADPFAQIEGDSVDYAVMEKTDRAAVVPVDMGWSDIGNWDALMQARLNEQGDEENCLRGAGELIDARGVMVDSDGPHVCVVGLDNVVVVVDGGEILVVARDAVQKVNKLKRQGA